MVRYGGAIAAVAVIAAALPAFAVPVRMTPAEIKATFGVGLPFVTTSSSGQSYLFTLMPDGTATQSRKGSSAVTAGKWRVNGSGYCSKWGAGAEHCYTIEKDGDIYDVRDSSGKAISRWAAPAA